MEKRPLTFKPTDDELEFLEEHNIGFSEFCHNAFKWAKNGDKSNILDKIGNRFLLVILGLGLYGLSYLVVNLFAWSILVLCGFFSVCFGSLGIIIEVKNGRRFRDSFS